MGKLYRKLREKARGCRDREIRIKLELILLGLKLGNVSEACARRGYSRKFYYKWLKRLKKAHWDLEALRERSRRPKRSPRQISKDKEQRIRYYQKRQYGARMIEAMMAREGLKVSRTTICHVFNGRRKNRKKKKKNLNPHRKRYELAIPGQRIQVDVKYVPEFVEGRRAYTYVAIDECTRWRFNYSYVNLEERSTCDFLEKMKEKCPFPIHTIQTDNGFEFTNRFHPTAPDREHSMDAWCKRNEIRHRLIPPGAKELNGKVERSHRIDEQYFYYRAPTDTLPNLNRHQTRWIDFYNENRLHGGLKYITPNEKLLERLQTLANANPFSEPELEKIRLNFLEETPKKLEELKLNRQQSFKDNVKAKPRLSLIEKLELKLELEFKKYRNVA
jgi:transposase InsO family protein